MQVFITSLNFHSASGVYFFRAELPSGAAMPVPGDSVLILDPLDGTMQKEYTVSEVELLNWIRGTSFEIRVWLNK